MNISFRNILSLMCLAVSFGLSAQTTDQRYIINEIMAANVDDVMSPTWNFDGWVELYNATGKSADLSGVYFSDDASNLRKWKAPKNMGTIPAKGYRLIWFDDRQLSATQVPFNLDMDGGTIYLSDSEGRLLSSATYPESVERASWARTTNGGSEWAYTSGPTPKSDNAAATYAHRQLAAPVVMPESGFFDETVSVSVDIPEGCELYYTYDGTLPTRSNGHRATGEDLIFGETTLLRFRLYGEGALASAVTTRSYLKRDRAYYLPTLSVVSDPRFLYDDSIGIYTRGVNGIPGTGQWTKANWNMEWDRPVNMSYFDPQGRQCVTKDVDMKIVGGWSRGAAMKSFKLKGRKEYGGDRDYPYQFFSAKPYLRNRTLHLRNGGNDEKCMLKDPALGTIIQQSGIDLDVQSYQPVHHFINGEYKGLINLREPSNKHFVYANQGWDSDEIDVFEMNCDSAYIQQCGTREGFERLYDLSKSAATQSVYEEIKQWLDIDEFINYMAMSLYLGRGDWPHNNMKGYRKTDGGRLRLVAFDIDAAFEQDSPFKYLEKEQQHTFNTLFNGKPQIKAEIEIVTIFLNLLKNKEFRQQFATSFCLMGGSVFEYQRSCDIVDSLYMHVEPALAFDGKSASSMASTIKSKLEGRATWMPEVMASYKPMQLTESTARQLNLSTDGTPGAHITINGQEASGGRFSGTLFRPAAIRAIVPPGFRFVGWRRSTTKQTTRFQASALWSYDTTDTGDADWTAVDYSVSSWPRAITTAIPKGTCRMRCHSMFIFHPSDIDQFRLTMKANRPFILYVNGSELMRHEGNTMETIRRDVPYSAFVSGKNVLAVAFPGGTVEADRFAIRLDHINVSGDGTIYSEKEQLHLIAMDEYDLTACFEPLAEGAGGLPPVRINEVSAVNSVYVSDFTKRSDWVELYNTTSQPVDLATLRLCGEPLLLPEGVSELPAYGHVVVWCDRREALTQPHADMKLPDDCATLTLSDADGTWEDTFTYPAHDGNSSVGRYPDGAGQVYFMHRPTIAQDNQLDSYTKLLYKESPTGIQNVQVVSAPWSLTYASQRLTLSGPDAAMATIYVYTAGGQQVAVQPTVVRSDFVYVDLLHLPQGVYIAKASDGKNTATAKFKL